VKKAKKRILLAVTGLSPQVVTETVYALAVQRRPRWTPTEIRVVTTAEGAERAKLTLLSSRSGWFERLRREYRLGPIEFDEKSIRVLQESGGGAMKDIRTAEDNEAAADALVEEVRRATADPEAAVHVSIAGGRKTMGFFAGYALSLYGREQDALSHVLVEPPFESHPEFFYPSREPRVIYTPPPESRPVDASQARVTLAEIPFVRLRTWLGAKGFEERAGFAEVVESLQRGLNGDVVIDYDRAELTIGETRVYMAPAELAFYAMVARASESQGGAPYPGMAPDAILARSFKEEYSKINAPKLDRGRTEKALEKGMDGEYFLQKRSKVNRALVRALGPRRAAPFLIRKIEGSPEARYLVTAGGAKIRFKG
jgi:CRISPR-associated protein (TIGR02584 family)